MFLFICQAAWAETAKPLTRAELSEKLKAYGSFSELEAKFRQVKTLTEMGLKIRSEGRLKLIRPHQIRWEVILPSPLVIQMNDQEIQIIIGKGSDAKKQTFKWKQASGEAAEKNLSELVAWLNMDVVTLDQNYLVFPDGKNRFRFEPRQKDATAFRGLSMEVSPEGSLKKLRMDELSGDRIDIEFEKPRIKKGSQSPGL